MVKRQTVWLSTMMVLSLMLIGYYTMNNQTSTASTSTGGETVSTSVAGASGNSTSTSKQSSGASSNSSNSANSSSSQSTASNPNDYFTNTRTRVDQQLSKQMDRLKAEMANNSSSSQQIAKASKELGSLMSLDGALGTATQAIEADGFKNAVIVPDASRTNFTVYVEANSLQKSDVVKIMNIVGQQLDTSMLNVLVKAHK